MASSLLIGVAVSSCQIPPSSIDATCRSDVSAALSSWIEAQPAGSFIGFPPGACYLVSQSPASIFTLNGVKGDVIGGNGATLKQTSYVCGSGTGQPVVQMTDDSHDTIANLNIEGPGTCGGPSNEGDYGIELGQSTPGDSNITFSGVKVNSVDGDGLGVLPQLGTCCGINKAIAFDNGSMSNIGYHAASLEGVNGITLSGDTFSGVGDFMDMEVDVGGPGNGSTPTGVAQWNVTVEHNTFTQGSRLNIYSNEGCVPQRNVEVIDNTVTASGYGIEIELGGSGSSACGGPDTGFSMVGNSENSPGDSPCGGSVGSPPAGCAMVEVQDYKGVAIENNSLLATDGQTNYYANTLVTPCIGLSADSDVRIENNACNNAYDFGTGRVWANGFTQFPENDFPTGPVTECGNVWGLTEPVTVQTIPTVIPAPPPAPVHDGACR